MNTSLEFKINLDSLLTSKAMSPTSQHKGKLSIDNNNTEKG